MSSLPRGVVTTGNQRWKHKLSSSQAAVAKFSAEQAEFEPPEVAVQTTVDSIQLPTSSSPKQNGECCFEGHQAVSQVRYHRNRPKQQRRDDSAGTLVGRVEATNENDYAALVVRLLSQVLDGQADAVTDLVNLSFPRLIVLCRDRLGKWLEDLDEDVALDVLFNFIRQYQAGVFPQVRDSKRSPDT